MLSSQQIAHFDTFGFLKLPKLFSPDEADSIRRASLETLGKLGPTDHNDAKTSQFSLPFFERNGLLAGLLDDDRIHQIPESLLGPDFFLDGTEEHLRAGDTAWHSATMFTEEIKFLKVAMYLDHLSHREGCLRIIPGTHRKGSPDLFSPLRDRSDEPERLPFGLTPSEVPCVSLESQPGDVLIFTENVIHGAFGGKKRRLQICASFFANPTTQDQTNQILSEYKATKYSLRPSESYVNSNRPRIRRMVSKLVELGFETVRI